MIQQEIIAKIKSGGEAELAMVYQEHREAFLHWIRKEYHCSEDDSKDVYQLVILIFFENIRSGKLEGLASSIKTYLFGIGKNIIRDNMRKSARFIPIDQQQWIQHYVMEETTSSSVSERTMAAAKNALARLGEPCRKLVELFYYEKLGLEEIAGLLNYKNPETAKNQKCKCMKRLRTLCEDELRKTSLSIDHEY